MENSITTVEPPDPGAATQISSDMFRQALAYVRVSGLSQVDGDGPVRQQIAFHTFAAEQQIQIVGTFSDLGVSGTIENMKRPAWAEMIAACAREDVR